MPHYITTCDTLPAMCSSVCGWRPTLKSRAASVMLFECVAEQNWSFSEFRAENLGSRRSSQSAVTVLHVTSVCLSCRQMSFFVCAFCYVFVVSWLRPLTLSLLSDHTCSSVLIKPTWVTSANHHWLYQLSHFQTLTLHVVVSKENQRFLISTYLFGCSV